MTDPFEELLHQLGKFLDVSLHVDKSHACTLQIHDKLKVQLELDPALEMVWIASFLIEIPPGRFRENVLLEALKTNHLPDPRTGILGFSLRKHCLTMHQRYPLALLTGEILSMYVASFIDYAELWRDAIQKGMTSPAPISSSFHPKHKR
jgi:hypothetical protein